MKITLEQRKTSSYYYKLYNRFQTIIWHIHNRCDNENNAEYASYGGRGVTYSDDWKTTAGFVADVDKIPGWDLDKFLDHELQLDKDQRVQGNKLYSTDTCLWLPRKQNMLYLPSRNHRKFLAFNELTSETDYAYNQSEFASRHGMNVAVLNSVLRGRKHRANHWYVWYEDQSAPVLTRYWVRTEHSVFWKTNKKQLGDALGMSSAYVYQMLTHPTMFKNGHSYAKTHRWEFWTEQVDLTMLFNK